MKKLFLFYFIFNFFSSFIQAQNHSCTNVGINFYFNCYWNREVPFSNLMMQGSPWVTVDSGWVLGQAHSNLRLKLSLDTNGYPTQIPQLVNGKPQLVLSALAVDNGAILPHGKYTLKYDGQGDVIPIGNDKIEIERKQNGEVIFTLEQIKSTNPVLYPGGDFWIMITRSEATNPVRNIRVLLPGVKESDAEYPFNPHFLNKIKPFSTIRFMNWAGAYWSEDVTWNNRRSATYYTQFNINDWWEYDNKSVAYEYMIKLCNLTKSNMWLNLPFQIDDHYSTQLAQMINRDLDSNLKLYLEYGNEVWNSAWSFSKQYNFVKDSIPSSLSGTDHQFRYAFHANKHFQNFSRYRKQNLVRVLAGQQANEEVLNQSILGMRFINAAGEFDAGSITDYATRGDLLSSLNDQVTVAEIAQIARNAMTESFSFIQKNKNLLDKEEKPLISYEGGFHLPLEYDFNNPPKYLNTVKAFYTDSACYNITKEWWRKLYRLDPSMQHMAFVLADEYLSPFGSYGHMENVFENDPANYPKYQGLLDFCSEISSNEEPINVSKVILFPNPTDDHFEMKFDDSKEKLISIYNEKMEQIR